MTNNQLAYYPPKEIIKIGFSTSDGVILFNFHEILYLQGQRNYTKVYAIGNSVLVSKNLSEILSMLPPSFIRIHKSYIVNINLVKNIDYINSVVELITGERIPFSIRLKKNLQIILQGVK